MRFLSYVVMLLCAATLALAQDEPPYKPPAGYVPDEATAIRIALAVWEPVFGAARIASEKPYHATLSDGVWTVRGTVPKLTSGGPITAQISKEDGKVIRVFYEK